MPTQVTGKRKRRENKCTICEKTFPSLKELQTHVLGQHSWKEKQEKRAQAKQAMSSGVVEQKPRKRKVKTTVCGVCGKIFKSLGLKFHMQRFHTDMKISEMLECDTCGKHFKLKENMKAHLKTHISMEIRRQKAVQCNICSKRFLTRPSLKTHIELHHVNLEPKFFCYCGKGFKAKLIYNMHLKHVHAKEQYTNIYVECEFCKKLMKKMYIPGHVKRYHTETTCDECGEMCIGEDALKAHKQIHTEKGRSRPFACDFPGCFKRYPTKTRLEDHKKIVHYNIRDFVCSYPNCGKAFGFKGSLSVHVRAVHGTYEKQPCPVEGCKYATIRRGIMAVHLRKIHKDLSENDVLTCFETIKRMKMA